MGPPMTFSAGDLMKPNSVKDGPMVVFWGQDSEEPFRGRCDLDYGPRPRMTVGDRLRRGRAWRLTLRIAPAPEGDLKTLGQDIARIFNVPYGGDPEPGDRAIWVPGGCKARTAGHALGSAGLALKRLGNLEVGAVQVRVEQWPPA